VIGYLVLFNENLAQYLKPGSTVFDESMIATPGGLRSLLLWINGMRLHFLYFGLFSVGVASIIYQARCPFAIKRYRSPAEYFDIEAKTLPLQMIKRLDRYLILPRNIASLDEKDAKAMYIRSFYIFQSNKHPVSRAAVSTLFLVGAVCLAIPALTMAGLVAYSLAAKLAG
jgi:hypothetical protein